jgi:hypothetical protein
MYNVYEYNKQNVYFTCCFVFVSNLASCVKGRTQIEGVSKQGA